MKKIITLIVAFLMVGIMVGCSKSAENTTGASSTVSTTVDVTTTTEEVTTTEAKEYIDGKKLVVFGDSITALGTWGETAATDLNMYFYNGAKGGITSDQGLERFDSYVRKQNPDFVTILFGQNDLLMEAKNQPKVTIEKFKENLTTMVGWVREMGAVPILMTNLFVNSTVFYTAQGQTEANYEDVGTPLEWLDQYNEATRQVAEELDCYLIDNRASVSDKYGNTYLLDGIHLNAKGNAKVAENVEKFFNEHYANDPTAKKVSKEDLYVYVNDETKTRSIVSFDGDFWTTSDETTMKFISAENRIQLYNTNGLWPMAEYAPINQISVPVENGYIKYDIEIANVTSSILIYIDGATPSAYSEGKYFSLNKLMTDKTNSVDDMEANQHLVGTIKLSDLGISKTCLHAGNVVISGVAVYVAGTAYEKVTINELSVSIE